MSESLDEMLTPSGRPVRVKRDGTFEEVTGREADYPPEIIYCDYDGPLDEAQISDDQERAMVADVKRECGWDVLTGWALGGGLAIMHNSQYIGDDLERHIRETPGLWDCVPVDLLPPVCQSGPGGLPCATWDKREECEHCESQESQAAGWALIYRGDPEHPEDCLSCAAGEPMIHTYEPSAPCLDDCLLCQAGRDTEDHVYRPCAGSGCDHDTSAWDPHAKGSE